MTDCPKLAKRGKLEEHPDADKCQNSNTPGLVVENTLLRRQPGNRPPMRNLTEDQKKVIEAYKQAQKPIKPKIERPQQSSLNDLN